MSQTACRSGGSTLERILPDLHSGRILGNAGVLVVDAAAFLYMLLVSSGIWLWSKRRASWYRMISQGVKSCSCALLAVFLGLISPVAAAEIYDITELQQPDTSSSAMTGFYAVTPDGETTLEDPLESGFATSAGNDFNPERPVDAETEPGASENDSTKASGKSKNKPKTRTIRIEAKRKHPERNLAEQFQCERHGFYYTHDGRCIIPAYGLTQPVPHTDPGMRPRVPGKW